MSEELKPCPWCGEIPTFSCYPTCDIIACRNPECAVRPRLEVEYNFCVYDRQSIVSAWNGMVK